MTVYISPNPGKEQAADTARRAAQLLLMQGAVVLMRAVSAACSFPGFGEM